MTQPRTIVGLGEAYLAEYPQRRVAAGLAAGVAMFAVRFGHRGVAVTRVGQDPGAEELLGQLRSAGVDVGHVQSDPDLATGRLVVRHIGAKVMRTLDARAAFDNVNWDFDLEDVVQRADAVVYGTLAQRGGQTRSVITRFVEACATAVRVYDLTNRGDGALDRVQAVSSLVYADGVVVDSVAMRALNPGAGDVSREDAARKLLRSADAGFVMWVDDGEPMEVHAADGAWKAAEPYDIQMHDAWVVALLHGTLRGATFAQIVEETPSHVAFLRTNPQGRIGDDAAQPDAAEPSP